MHHPAASPFVALPRLGLCCQFAAEPISFRMATATALLRLSNEERLRKLADIALGNALALEQAIEYCARVGIGCFRVISTLLPAKTHPAAGYRVEQLPGAEAIVTQFRKCGAAAARHGVRLVFHPDQFVVLNSPRPDVVEKSLADLAYHAELCDWLGADVINIHGGGAYGDKKAALDVLKRNIDALPEGIHSRLTLENDDKIFTPQDLLPVCRATGVPLVYDVHHHRCLPDGMPIGEATEAAIATWNREPLFHLSSPLEGWSGPQPFRHHDYVDLADFPDEWRRADITIEVEAKAKELAVLRLRDELAASTKALSLGDSPTRNSGKPRNRRCAT
ncbi:MAG: UV DNA damage repair endonuclease UvsE [Planctomycetales bacterium]|nr:UV DNA damage repair endonuclease UvsE [Planctomycetales bacterium]MBN8627980.1 UV DNA damage repair endonuclease UvsE [Planctomycetota bacterium]